MHSPIMKHMLLITTCIVLVAFCSFNLHAAQGKKAIHVPLLQKVFQATGLEAETVTLNRGDSITKGIYIENMKGYSVLIGLPERGISRGTPFLLSIDGEEALVTLSEEGTLRAIDTNAMFIPTGINSMIECVLNAVEDYLDNLDACGSNPFCYAITSLIFSVELTICLADLF